MAGRAGSFKKLICKCGFLPTQGWRCTQLRGREPGHVGDTPASGVIYFHTSLAGGICARKGARLEAGWCQDAKAKPGGEWAILADELVGTQGHIGSEETQAHQAWGC